MDEGYIARAVCTPPLGNDSRRANNIIIIIIRNITDKMIFRASENLYFSPPIRVGSNTILSVVTVVAVYRRGNEQPTNTSTFTHYKENNFFYFFFNGRGYTDVRVGHGFTGGKTGEFNSCTSYRKR